MEEKPKQIKACGLWQNTTKNGITFLSGNLGYGLTVQIWPNKKREGKKDPDYNLVFAEPYKKPTGEIQKNFIQEEPKAPAEDIQDPWDGAPPF